MKMGLDHPCDLVECFSFQFVSWYETLNQFQCLRSTCASLFFVFNNVVGGEVLFESVGVDFPICCISIVLWKGAVKRSHCGSFILVANL